MARQPVDTERPRSILPDPLADLLFKQGRVMHLKPQQTLFLAGDPGDGCALVDEGLLKVHVLSPSGSERILAILGPAALVGELSMIDGHPRSTSVTALKDSKLRFVSRAAFDRITQQHPEVYRQLALGLTQRLRDIDDALTATSFLPLRGRTARALLSLADAFGKDVGRGKILIRQKISQSDIAGMAGIARENVSRILQDWMRQGMLTRLAGYYCIESPSALAQERDLSTVRPEELHGSRR